MYIYIYVHVYIYTYIYIIHIYICIIYKNLTQGLSADISANAFVRSLLVMVPFLLGSATLNIFSMSEGSKKAFAHALMRNYEREGVESI